MALCCEVTVCCCLFQMFLTVYLSNNEQHFTEVPVTPETTCRDVVELCKEPGESECHLAEVWCGSGRLGSLSYLIRCCGDLTDVVLSQGVSAVQFCTAGMTKRLTIRYLQKGV